ncbi:MAG TPA: TonB-dependent receptor [Gemmatimonadaceae bacterium]|nr:TonB-dependent receptor [Gemmatimonadaceae bacterium]
MGARCAIGCAAAAIITALPATARTQGTRLRGLVFDSVAALPLKGAHVELVNVDDRSRVLFSATSDSLGNFVLDRIAHGRYIAGFFHPVLDSLGLALTQRVLTIVADGEVHFDLAVPSPERLEGALCGPGEDKNTNGAVIGYVLNSHSLAAAESTTVIAEWAELILQKSGVGHEVFSRRARTDGNGWFVVCGVPTASSVVVRAVSGSDTSGAIEMDVPKSRIVRRNLYIDHLPSRDSTGPLARDSAAVVIQNRHTAGLSGWVRTEDGVPISGARVKLYGSDTVAITDKEGAFQLAGVPGGTQTLNTRAIGFVPDDRPVDLTDRHVPVVVGLLTIRRFLDTVHVRAAKPTMASAVGFDDRKRVGAGQFFTASDIERFHPHELTDVLRHVPGISVSTDNQHHVSIRMRGDAESCTPVVFLDGKQLVNWELSDVNGLVDPETVAAMEVYTPAMTPPEFRTQHGCGTILLWTRAPR